LGTDYFGLRDELTAAEREYLKVTRAFVDTEVLPVISGYWERAEFPWPLIKKMGSLGIVGDGIEGYGCPPMSPVAGGLIHMELNRGDGSPGTIHAVQAGLAMRSIWLLGSEGGSPSPGAPSAMPRRLRGRAGLHEAAHAVRQAAGGLPARARSAGEDARRGHRDAAVLPAREPPRRAGQAHRHHRGAGQDEQHPQGPPSDRRCPGPVGGNGILLDHHVMRHMADIEAIYTYEGTEHIQTLIVGRDITGVGAFSS
jgi:alkylation response protein AidB-like acyl-CoA dehydrogenase